MLVFLKLLSGFLIGKIFGTYAAKGKLPMVLGLALTVACAMLACVVIDNLAGV
jgi:hypothetical protein